MEVARRHILNHLILLASLVLIGTFLRVYQLGTQSLWDDEAFSVWISKLSVPQMVQITAADVHPPLYYYLLHYWTIIFGTSESALRLVSVLFGVLAIPMIYVVGRQLFNEEAGLLGALILALSSFVSLPLRKNKASFIVSLRCYLVAHRVYRIFLQLFTYFEQTAFSLFS